jgi:DNA repair exonuclease SbcCD ATPase subunit
MWGEYRRQLYQCLESCKEHIENLYEHNTRIEARQDKIDDRLTEIEQGINDREKEFSLQQDTLACLKEDIATLRCDIDELKGNYQHNVTPMLEVARDNMISNNQDISEIEDRLDAIEEMTGLSLSPMSLDDIVEPVPDIVTPGFEPGNAQAVELTQNMPKGKVLTIQEIASDFIKSIKAFNDITMEYRKDFEKS